MTTPSDKFLFKFSKQDCADVTGTNSKAVERVQTEVKRLKEEGFENNVANTVGAIGEELAAMQNTPGLAPICVPLTQGRVCNIDVVEDFNWTKTGKKSIARKNTPKLVLQESLVSSPAFFNNLVLISNALIKQHNPGFSKDFDAVGIGAVGQQGVHKIMDWMQTDKAGKQDSSAWLSVPDKVKTGVDNILHGVNFLKTVTDSVRETAYNVERPGTGKYWLNDYEPMYGVQSTNFIYRLPYMTDTVKEISNAWSTDSSIIGGYTDMMKQITSLVAPGVGIDLSKTFDFPDTGPTHEVKFYLDNTIPDTGESTERQKNFRFIFLLLYQNLPNKLSRVAIQPPVIYKANLPGVFSYRWSYLSKLSVNFIGNRRPAELQVAANSDKQIQAIIPEGYEISLSLTSLTPETKNLMYDAVDGRVTSSEKSAPQKTWEERVKETPTLRKIPSR